MISPQSIAVATASAKLTGQEGTLFRFTLLHSIGLIFIICVIAYVQANYATWMIPKLASASAAMQTSGLSLAEIFAIVTSILIIFSLLVFVYKKPIKL
jgi:hypothetical protein